MISKFFENFIFTHVFIQPVSPNTSKINNNAAEGSGESKNAKGNQLLPGFFIISCIVVAILLIVILSAAGAIACYRNHQQEQIITSMHERLSDIQSSTKINYFDRR